MLNNSASGHLTLIVPEESPMLSAIHAFVIDCQARHLSPRTIEFYEFELRPFREYLEAQRGRIRRVEDITPTHIRAYLIQLGKTRSPGGVHCAFRSIRAFLNWYGEEYEPENWKNPIRKVQAPKVAKELKDPIPLADVQALLATCKRRDFYGDRDRAIILCLLDSGCRANEFCSLRWSDVNMRDGAVTIRHETAKGDKSRTVFFGAKARKAILSYMRHRPGIKPGDPLWVSIEGEQLQYDGLEEMLCRRCRRAGIRDWRPHAFRHAFAICSLENGADLSSIQRIMGHASITTTMVYLKRTHEGLSRAHQRSSPVDNLL